jgi:signal transduction histidine kinase
VSDRQTRYPGDLLIVDDKPANLRLLSQMLIKHGHTIRAVVNGTQALASVERALPDLILLDVKMPGMDGYEVCERLKADPRTRDVPIIFISALGETEDKVKAFTIGGVDYVTKPFQLEEVLARVETHLGLRNLQKDLERANEDLAQQRDTLDTVLCNVADGLVFTDPAGKILLVNPAFGRIPLDPPDPLEGAALSQVLPFPELLNIVDDALQAQGSVHTVDVTLPDQRIFRASACGLCFNRQQVTGVVTILRDITHDVEIDRMKTNFVSMVSHDLRTPLGVILGFAEMLETGVYGPLSDRQQEALKHIVTSVKRQLNLVDNLLDQARIETGMLSLEITSFEPVALVKDTLADLGILAQGSGLELTSHVAADVPTTLSGDRQRLHQVLNNLVDNAIKFTKRGSVSVRIYRPDETHWALAVLDTGPGIPVEAQEYVFDPFRQIDNSITREHVGVGLGLTIVKQLVTLMGGEITLESKVGQGSTFTVVLPLVIQTQEEVS